MRTLLVEAHPALADAIAAGLTRASFAVDVAGSVAEAREAVGLVQYDLAILDLGLPDGSGLDLLGEWQVEGHFPTIIMTARGALGDRIAGLDSGADNYIVKPVEIPELVARCRAILRRPGNRESVTLTAGCIRLDTGMREAHCSGHRLDLGRREMRVLEALLRRQIRVVQRSALVEALYDRDTEVTPNAVDAAVSRLRRAIVAANADVTTQDDPRGGLDAEHGGNTKTGDPGRHGLQSILSTQLLVIAAVVIVANIVFIAVFDASDRSSLVINLVRREVLRLEAVFLDGDQRPEALAAAIDGIYDDHPGAYAFAVVASDGAVLGGKNVGLIPTEMLRPGAFATDWLAWPSGTDALPVVALHSLQGADPDLSLLFLMASDPADLLGAEVVDEFWGHVWLPLLPIAILLIGGTLLIIRRALRPVSQAAEWARTIRPGKALPPLELTKAPAEVEDLTEAVRRSIERLDAELERRATAGGRGGTCVADPRRGACCTPR